MGNLYKDYTKNRFTYNSRRAEIWREISVYMERFLDKSGSIVELGSGYCDFINQVRVKSKYALDKYINPKKFCKAEVTPILGSYPELDKKIKNNSINVFFASNFFEHLAQKELQEYMYKK